MPFGRKAAGIDPRAAADKIASHGALALDVREPGEWQAGRIPGAVHMPMREVAHRASELPRDRELIAVCRSGSRSGRVARALEQAGYRVANLEGGMKAWQAAQLPLEPRDGRIA